MDAVQAFQAMRKAADDYTTGDAEGDDLHSAVVDYTDALWPNWPGAGTQVPKIRVSLARAQEGRDVPVVAENVGPYPSVEAALADWPGFHVATDDEYAAYVAYWSERENV